MIPICRLNWVRGSERLFFCTIWSKTPAKLFLITQILVILFEPRREKPDFCICENKDADQLRGNREADQRLCFRYTDSIIPLLPKSEISSPQLSSVIVPPGLCRTWSETPKTGFLTSRLIYRFSPGCICTPLLLDLAQKSGNPEKMTKEAGRYTL